MMVPLQPLLSFFCPQRQRQEIGSTGIDRLNNMILAHFADFAEAWIHGSYARQAAWPGVKLSGGRCSNTFRAAEQEDGQPTRPAGPDLKLIEQIGACCSFLDR